MLDFTDFSALVFYFTVYAFLGWLLENITSLVTTGNFFKVNFWLGPFKPMYGIAPVLLLSFLNANSSWITMIVLCLLIPTTVEYISGFLLEKMSKRKWWDYSQKPLNIHGYICPFYSICWLILSWISLHLVQPVLNLFYTHIQSIWSLVSPFIFIYFIVETTFASKRHYHKRTSFSEQTT